MHSPILNEMAYLPVILCSNLINIPLSMNTGISKKIYFSISPSKKSKPNSMLIAVALLIALPFLPQFFCILLFEQSDESSNSKNHTNIFV